MMTDQDYGEVAKSVALLSPIKKFRGFKDENIEAIKEIIKNLGEEDITADQFIGLVSQHTRDRGLGLSRALTEDLNTFRRMAVKVYENMTQDVSDVLANEQMELARMYEEKHRITIAQILELCRELKLIYPPFRFEDYYAGPEEYLRNAFVIPEMPEEEDVDTMKRQLAYHRLKWLQGEFDRMKIENLRLEKRLVEQKKRQREFLKTTVRNEVEAEQTHLELTQAEHSMQEKLEGLLGIIHDRFLDQQRIETERKKFAAKKRGDAKKRARMKKRPWDDVVPIHAPAMEEYWQARTAHEIETSLLAEHVQSEVSRLTISATSTKRGPLSRTELGSPTISMRQQLVDRLNTALREMSSAPCQICEPRPEFPTGSALRQAQDITFSRPHTPEGQLPSAQRGPRRDIWQINKEYQQL